MPSAFLTASASLVRCEIRFLSISAARANAKAIILEFILSDRSKLSFIVCIDIPLAEHTFNMDITMSIFLPSLDSSVQTSRSPFSILSISRPSPRFSIAMVPDTDSDTHPSIRMFFLLQYFTISNLWFSRVCISVLTLTYA